jgi:hypothetical protein
MGQPLVGILRNQPGFLWTGLLSAKPEGAANSKHFPSAAEAVRPAFSHQENPDSL